MASNTSSPNGFSFIRNNLSGAPTYQTTIQEIASTNANSFGKGDVVKLLSSGYIDRALTTDTVVLGVMDWVEYYDTVQLKKVRTLAWLAPSTALAGSVYASVITDTQAVFAVQSGNGGPVVQANVGLNINFAANAAPNTTTGLSTAYADFGTVSTASAYPFRVLGLGYNNYLGPIGNSGYDNTLANNIIEVMANPGAWLGTSATGI